MRISDWSSDVCSSDLPPSTEATTTSEAPNEATTTTEATTTSAPSTTTTVPETTTTTSRDSEELTPSGPATPGTIGEEPSTSIDGTRVVKAGESFWSIAEDVRSEEHTSELQSLMRISYAVFCLKNKKEQHQQHVPHTDSRSM